MERSCDEVRRACRDLIAGYVIVIGQFSDSKSNRITLQSFVRSGEAFIPVFSDETHFRNEMAGSGFEEQGLAIKCDLFVSSLRDDERLVLNPGSDRPLEFIKADFFEATSSQDGKRSVRATQRELLGAVRVAES